MRSFLFHLLLILMLIISVSSCRTATPNYDYQSLARSSIKLGVDINQEDNHKLYTYAANWIGTPHRLGGNSKSGIDCSGLTSQIYKSVYKKELPRRTTEQLSVCIKVPRNQLREGDLVFFSTNGKKKTVGHVGVYLKDGKFIHTSSSSGVRVNDLNEPYYKNNWISGGRIK